MIENELNGLLRTIHKDKANVLEGLREQSRERIYKTPEVIALLELSFALIEASIMTEMEKR